MSTGARLLEHTSLVWLHDHKRKHPLAGRDMSPGCDILSFMSLSVKQAKVGVNPHPGNVKMARETLPGIPGALA